MYSAQDFPYGRMFVLSSIAFADAFQINAVAPFLPEMVASLGVSPDTVGYWVGSLTSAFSLAQFLSAFWSVVFVALSEACAGGVCCLIALVGEIRC